MGEFWKSFFPLKFNVFRSNPSYSCKTEINYPCEAVISFSSQLLNNNWFQWPSIFFHVLIFCVQFSCKRSTIYYSHRLSKIFPALILFLVRCCFGLHDFLRSFRTRVNFLFLKKWAIPGLFFIYFRLFNTVDNKQMFNKILPMTGVEPRTSGIGSDRSTNWAATTSQQGLNLWPIFWRFNDRSVVLHLGNLRVSTTLEWFIWLATDEVSHGAL